MLESSTGDSRNEVGLSPGGIVTHGEREIGSFAGDMSLYLAPPPAGAASGAELGLDPGRFGSSERASAVSITV